MPPEDKRGVKTNLSCTFCGPGTWATWEVVIDDGIVFACDRHHVEMSEAKMISLERIRGKKTWYKIPESREILFEEEYLDDLTNIEE
jgi:hypothetical protein